MCLIIHKPANHSVPLWLIESALDSNPDGVGAMYRGIAFKVIDATANEVHKYLQRHMAEDMCIHFRMATHGEVNVQNAHPHKVGPLWLMHNGVLNQYAANGVYWTTESDTRLFCEKYLAPKLRKGRLPKAKKVEKHIGRNNRIVTMDKSGRFTFYNKDTGYNGSADLDGLWLSNTYAWQYPHEKQTSKLAWSPSWYEQEESYYQPRKAATTSWKAATTSWMEPSRARNQASTWAAECEIFDIAGNYEGTMRSADWLAMLAPENGTLADWEAHDAFVTHGDLDLYLSSLSLSAIEALHGRLTSQQPADIATNGFGFC